jgi:hypothetical protein
MAPAGYKASEPMLMWEALRQATDEVRALSRPHAAHFIAAGLRAHRHAAAADPARRRSWSVTPPSW